MQPPREYHLTNNLLRDLKILIKVFRSKLQERRYVSPEDCSQLFPALDELLVSCTKLYSQLKENMLDSEPHTNHKIGDILVHNFSHTTSAGLCIREAYARLGARKLIAVKYYRDKCKDKAFKALMDDLESKKMCKRRTYADFLLSVTTRLTKYPPLLKNLYKNTPESHPDHPRLREAISVIEDSLHYINSTVEVENLRAELELCQARLEVKGRCSRELKHFDLTSNKRRLIHRDHLTLQAGKAGSKDSKISKIQMFLYNDYILLLKDKDNKLILNFDEVQCPAIKVKGCLVKNNNSQKLPGFIMISNSGKRSDSPQSPTLYQLNANSTEEVQKWIGLITAASASEPVPGNSLSSDERYDSEESDVEAVTPDVSISFDSDNVDLLADASSIHTPGKLS